MQKASQAAYEIQQFSSSSSSHILLSPLSFFLSFFIISIHLSRNNITFLSHRHQDMAEACSMVIRSMFPFIRLVLDGAGFVNSKSILYINCQHKFLRLFSMTTNVRKKIHKTNSATELFEIISFVGSINTLLYILLITRKV